MRWLLALALVASPASAQVIYPPAGNVTQSQLNAVAATIPAPSSSVPPSVADSGAAGNMDQYARANHTHASKARKGRVLVPANGQYTVTFGTAMGSAPLCAVTAEATSGDTNVVNAQVDGVTTSTGFNIRITRTAQSVVALLGLTILSVPTQVATYAHYICVEI